MNTGKISLAFATLGVVVAAAVGSFFLFSAAAPPASDSASLADSETQSTVTDEDDSGAVYVATTEIPLGPSVLVPGELEIDGTDVALRFDMFHLAPVLGEPAAWDWQPFRGWDVIPVEEQPTVFPDQWTLVVNGQDISGNVANFEARAARFKVPEGTVEADIDSIRIDRYRLLYPVDVPFEINPNEEVEILEGITANVLQIFDQSESTIVRIEVTAAGGADISHVDLIGRGPGWVVGVRQAEGGDVWNLTYDGDLREPITLSLRGSLWLDVDSGVSFTMGVSP